MAQTFPQFSDGDVEIQLSSTDDKIIVHSYVLALHSPWFKASLSERWSGNTQSTLSGGKRYFTYELRFDKGSSLGMLTRKHDSTSDDPASDTVFIAGSMVNPAKKSTAEARKLREERLTHIKSLRDVLGAFYHVNPGLSHVSFDTATSSIISLASVADIYGCHNIVKLHIECHLRLYREEVLDKCTDDPVAMLELALKVQSEWIFMEAATHLLGRSNRVFEESQAKLTEMGIADMMNAKRATFVGQLGRCELDLFCLEVSGSFGKPWRAIATAFFQQWLSKEIRSGHGSGLCPGYARTYRTIAESSFDTAAIEEYLKTMGYTATASSLEGHLPPFLAEAKAILNPILKSATRKRHYVRPSISRNTARAQHEALTCVGLDDDEIPWVAKGNRGS